VCVQEANLGKVAKSCTAQIKESIFLKINQNYFAHICPEYGFRVNWSVYLKTCVVGVCLIMVSTVPLFRKLLK